MERNKVIVSLEFLIVLFIIFSLTVIMFFSYLKHIRYAMITEGKSLIYSIAKLEKAYYVEYSSFLPIENSTHDQILDIDIRTNSYFNTFSVIVPGTEQDADFSVFTNSTGKGLLKNITLILHGYKNKPSIFIMNEHSK
jgi:Tfp pilus assembly protein PilE